MSDIYAGVVGTLLATLLGCNTAETANQFVDECASSPPPPGCYDAESASAGDDDDEDDDGKGDDADDDDDEGDDDDDGGNETDGEPDPETGDEPGEANGLPCAVQDALAANCQMCHSDPPAFGAPMPLVDFEDLAIPTPSDPATPVYDKVVERMLDVERPMPEDGVMPEHDRQAIIDWVSSGAAEEMADDCSDGKLPPTDGVGPEYLPCEPDVVITAHAPGSEQPFHVPEQGADNLYKCFAFQAPFDKPTQATHWAPIIDDERVVHHWILYRTETPANTDTSDCDVSLQLSADFVAGWAPGGGNIEMPEGVGLELGKPGDWYQLQVHYHNAAHYADANDQSGVAFCTADEPRPQSAGILTTGTTSLFIPGNSVGHEATGECASWRTAAWPQDLHIMSSAPHMHALGAGFNNYVTHADGTRETIVDIPNFDWENQKMYFNEPEIIVRPGDSITTTCRFDNPGSDMVFFGEGSEEEMCFNFILAYPIEMLPSRNCGISILG